MLRRESREVEKELGLDQMSGNDRTRAYLYILVQAPSSSGSGKNFIRGE